MTTNDVLPKTECDGAEKNSDAYLKITETSSHLPDWGDYNADNDPIRISRSYGAFLFGIGEPRLEDHGYGIDYNKR